MRNISFLAFAMIVAAFSSCKLDNVNPQQPTTPISTKSDTSTTLISNTSLVGTWNIVTDSVFYATSTTYHGLPGDHFIFTKYGNLYVSNGFSSQLDTAVYGFPQASQVSWITSFYSQNGTSTRTPLAIGPYQIDNLTSSSLTLSISTIVNSNIYYERIIFTKQQ